MKLIKSHVRYDMTMHFFTCRIVNLWNSLPATVVHASSVNNFKNKLDAYWSNQEMMYNYQAEISGTGTINKNSSGDEIANVLVNDDIAHT